MFLGEPGRTSIGSYYEIWMDGRKYAEGRRRWSGSIAAGPLVPLPDAIAAPLRAGNG